MSQEDIILELLKTLIYSRQTLVKAHNELALNATHFSGTVKETEWNIFKIDDTLQQIGAHIPKTIAERYVAHRIDSTGQTPPSL